MKRWALRILSVALVAVAAGASWHAYSLRTDLESQTAELNALELRLSQTEDMHADAKHQLLIKHREFTGMAKELKAARAEIRRRQPCLRSIGYGFIHPPALQGRGSISGGIASRLATRPAKRMFVTVEDGGRHA